MLQTKTSADQINDHKNNTAIDGSKYIAHPADSQNEWYPVEVGTERPNLMACGNMANCTRGVHAK
jgi:hypothetical protein